ncbi:MAG: DUF177 domain-containing protein [bacterium]|nr:DUF177 domain-containing protein [bacterium]
MHKILIEDIEKEPHKIYHCVFDEYIDELDCNISAVLDLKIQGEYISVVGNAKGKIPLICDRCLNQFEYDLNINIEEIYAKNSLYEEYSQEVELKQGQFITDLNGEKEIDIYDLLYQSVILSLPNKKVCGINCKEGMFVSDEETKVHDSRMDIFKTIKVERKD